MTHHSGRGGKREGAGRPPGSPNRKPPTKHTDKTERLYERLTPEELNLVRDYIRSLREEREK
jgi:hypothetical protein